MARYAANQHGVLSCCSCITVTGTFQRRPGHGG